MFALLSLNLRVSIQHSHASLLLRLLWHLLDSRFCKSLSLKLFGAFGLYVCQFKDLCQYWTKSFKCDGFSYVWYYLLVKVWFFLYMMSFTRSWWVYLCELDWGLRLKLNCYSYYYLCGSSIWWVLCCGDLLGSYDFQNAKNALYTLFKFVVTFKSVSQSLQFSPSNIIMMSMCSYCYGPSHFRH